MGRYHDKKLLNSDTETLKIQNFSNTRNLRLEFHLPAHGGGTSGRGQIKRENPGFGGSGRPRAAGKPLKKVQGFAPHPF